MARYAASVPALRRRPVCIPGELGRTFLPFLNQTSNQGGAAWPAANRALFFPFLLEQPMIITDVAALAGGAVAGSLDIGVYSLDGTRIFSLGSTTQTSGGFYTLPSPARVNRGWWYAAVACNLTTTLIWTFQANTLISTLQAGIYEQNSAFPLPATATYAALSALPNNVGVPIVSLHAGPP